MKRLFQSLSRTDDGAFIVNADHQIIFWNQSAEKILGYGAAEAIGRLCYKILGGQDEQGRTLCRRYCLMAIQADRGDIFPSQDVFAHTQAGTGRWLNVTTFAYPVADQAIGQVIVHLFRDVTEKKRYQHFVEQVLSASERLQQGDGYRIISSGQTEPQKNGLTGREWQVLQLLAQGLGTNEIADTLTISLATVRNHVQNILSKLGVHSRLEAIAYAYQHGLIGIDES